MIRNMSIDEVMELYPKGTNKRSFVSFAKENECCRKIGRQLFFTEADLIKLNELLLCPSKSKSQKVGNTGTLLARTKASELGKARERLTRAAPRSSKTSLKRKCSSVVSLVQSQ